MTSHSLFGGKGFAAFIFDMDGTLLSSIAAAERIWRQWALRHGLDVAGLNVDIKDCLGLFVERHSGGGLALYRGNR